MARIDIEAETYNSFTTEDFNDAYVIADPSAAPAWDALEQDDKNRLAVTVTRVLKRQPWIDGVPSFDGAPELVQEAAGEFIIALVNGYDLATPAGSILQVRRQKAGSVEVEYFGNFDSPAYVPPPLPQAVWDLIKSMLTAAPAGGIGLAGSIASGTCGTSITEPDRFYDRSSFGYGSGDRNYD